MSKYKVIMSPCRRYRYTWFYQWDHKRKGFVQFIGLNPSTADEDIKDPTVTRCINFAKSWGYAGLYMTNIFAFRATDPKDMKKAARPVGRYNDSWLKTVAERCDVTIAAWGDSRQIFK
jgi:hypothetical protein